MRDNDVPNFERRNRAGSGNSVEMAKRVRE